MCLGLYPQKDIRRMKIFLTSNGSLVKLHWRRSVQGQYCYLAFIKAVANIHRERLGQAGSGEEVIIIF
jgi:hypothetical protein